MLAPNISPKEVKFECGRLFGFIPHKLQKSKRKPFRALKALMVIVICSQSTMFIRTIAAKKKGKIIGRDFPRLSSILISSLSTRKQQRRNSVPPSEHQRIKLTRVHSRVCFRREPIQIHSRIGYNRPPLSRRGKPSPRSHCVARYPF